MDFTAKFIQLQPLQKGQGKNGTWQKQEFIVETQDQYPKKVCCSLWGDKVADLQKISPGDLVKVHFSLESREYNGRWYTDVKAYRVEKSGSSASREETPWPQDMSIPQESQAENIPDDLPF